MSVEYRNDKVVRINSIIVSTKHTNEISSNYLREFVRKETTNKVFPMIY